MTFSDCFGSFEHSQIAFQVLNNLIWLWKYLTISIGFDWFEKSHMALRVFNNIKSINRRALFPLVVMACEESPSTPSSMSLVCWSSSQYDHMFYLDVLICTTIWLYVCILMCWCFYLNMLIIAIVQSTSTFIVLSISISELSSIDDDFPKRWLLPRSLAKSWDVRGKPILNALPKLWLKTAFIQTWNI